MIYDYILIKDGYQGRGATVLAEMGKVESTSVEGAIVAVQAAHKELVENDAHHVYVRPENVAAVVGTVLT